MWLSERASRGAERETAVGLGEVTIAGAAPGVMTDGERRSLNIVSPGGFLWRPSAGATVLVLKSADGESFVAGAPQREAPADLKGGEIMIKSGGGASIRLNNDGSIELSGTVRISGSLFVNGAAYKPCTCL